MTGYSPQQPPIFLTAPPRRGGFGWMILSLVLLGIIGLFLLGQVGGFLSQAGGGFSSLSGDRRFEEITLENSGALEKIAVVPVEGIITSQPWDPAGRSMVDVIEDQLRLAGKDSEVKAVILKVDSPGGEVLASDDISRAIIQFQETHKKPVIASMGGVAASGGYYVSAPCRWIVANELTITGSIGVILSSFNYRGLMDKVGLSPVVFKSGKHKDMLGGSRNIHEIDPAEKEMLQNMIGETYAQFKSVVKSGRESSAKQNEGKGRPLDERWEEYADGRILTGKNAYELGFVDQLGNFKVAVETARRLTGIAGNARLIRYEEPFSLGRMFGLGLKSRARAGAESPVLKIDLGLKLPNVEPGRPYFLSPTVLH